MFHFRERHEVGTGTTDDGVHFGPPRLAPSDKAPDPSRTRVAATTAGCGRYRCPAGSTPCAPAANVEKNRRGHGNDSGLEAGGTVQKIVTAALAAPGGRRSAAQPPGYPLASPFFYRPARGPPAGLARLNSWRKATSAIER